MENRYLFTESFTRKEDQALPKLIIDNSVNAIYVYIGKECYIFSKAKDKSNEKV